MRYLSLEGLCNLSTTEFSREAVRKHQDVVLNALKVQINYVHVHVCGVEISLECTCIL